MRTRQARVVTRRSRVIATLAAIALMGGVVSAGAWPASADDTSDDGASKTATVTFPDGSVETFEAEPSATFEIPVGQQPMAGFSWEASYEWRIISREWADSAGGTVSITTNAIRNCGGDRQILRLLRELVDDNYVTVGEPRDVSCTNGEVNLWHNIPHTDRYAFMLESLGDREGMKSASGSVSY